MSVVDPESVSEDGVVDVDETESFDTRRWLEECRKHPLVKCIEYDVPSGILPPNYRGVITDVKVGGKKRQPDDKIYFAHKELRDKVARGNCVLELHRVDKGKIVSTKYVFMTFALKKFSGGMGDEDKTPSAVNDWAKYFIKPLSVVAKVVSTEKANGEAGHVSARKLLGRNYFCIGSKNVHMFLRGREDLARYTDGRFEFARRVAETFFFTFVENPEIPQDQKESFYHFIQSNKYTSVFEMIQPENQHVVNLSYLERPQLRFICWTNPDLEENFNGDSLCSLPVHEAIEKAKDFGLTTIDYDIPISNPEQDVEQAVEDYMQKVREETGYEGKVLYFLDKDNNTIGLIKKKTAWYIILRAIREKVARFDSASVSELCNKVERRINEIQRWLEFSDSYRDSWKEIGVGFVKWLSYNKREQTSIRPRFPIIFDNFLNDANSEKYKIALGSLEGKF